MTSWHGLSLPDKSRSEENSSDTKPVCAYAVANRHLRYKGLADVLTEWQIKTVTRHLVGDRQALAQVAFDVVNMNVTRIGKDAVGFTVVRSFLSNDLLVESATLPFIFLTHSLSLGQVHPAVVGSVCTKSSHRPVALSCHQYWFFSNNARNSLGKSAAAVPTTRPTAIISFSNTNSLAHYSMFSPPPLVLY